MIELGWPAGTRSVARPELQAYADEAVFEAEQDEESPLALWNARWPGKESRPDG